MREGVEVLVLFLFLHMNLKKGVNFLRSADITSYSLTDYSTLIEVASEKGYVQPSESDKLDRMAEKPSRMGKISS